MCALAGATRPSAPTGSSGTPWKCWTGGPSPPTKACCFRRIFSFFFFFWGGGFFGFSLFSTRQAKKIKRFFCRGPIFFQPRFEACLEHLTRTARDGAGRAYISVFPAQHPVTGCGPRVWSDQLIRFAGFQEESGGGVGGGLGGGGGVGRGWKRGKIEPAGMGPQVKKVFGSIYQGNPCWVHIFDPQPGEIVGDPANLDFTTMVQTHFGWKPPSKGHFQVPR